GGAVERFLEVRALCERARRPAIRLFLGLALLAPAGLMAHARTTGEIEAETESPPVVATAAEQAVADSADGTAHSAVMEAWRAGVLERRRAELTARLATKFDVPLDLAEEIHTAALEERIDPELGFKLVRAESSFRVAAVSPVGAVGLTQV